MNSLEDPTTRALTIGSLARATGVPANTLRTWERRYGFPESQRTPGGHRLYPARTVAHVELVQQALGAGHRPAQILQLPYEELRSLVEDTRPADAAIDRLMQATLDLDAPALERMFAAEISRRGAVPFFDQLALPFLKQVGEAWTNGELEVYHEHFASERLTAFLSARWYAASAGDRGNIVLAGLEGEEHLLGLHLVATVLSQEGWNPIYLGRNTPVAHVVACARQVGARYVGVTFSIHTSAATATAAIEALLAALPPGIQLLCGGAGAPDVSGVHRVTSLDALATWLRCVA